MAKNPDVYIKLREDLLEEKQRYPYFEACWFECFRHVATFPSSGYEVVVEDFELGGVHLPKHTSIVVNRAAALANYKYGKSDKSFYPDRWLDDPQAAQDMAKWAFSKGYKRGCVGREFARIEAISVLRAVCVAYSEIHLVEEPKRYIYAPAPIFDPPLQLRFVE